MYDQWRVAIVTPDTARTVELESDALGYLRERLTLGNTLGRMLIQHVDFELGTTLTIVPSTATDEEARRLRAGLHSKTQDGEIRLVANDARIRVVPHADVADELAEIVISKLASPSRMVCVFEDSLARTSDLARSKYSREKILTKGDEVYHLLTSSDSTRTQVVTTIKRAQSWLLIGAIADHPDWPSLAETRRVLTDADLQAVAIQAHTIILDSHDGDGYVLWRKAFAPTDGHHRA